MKKEYAIKHCHKHNEDYQAVCLFNLNGRKIFSECSKCADENEARNQAIIEAERKAVQETIDRLEREELEDNLNNANMPKRYKDKQCEMTQNFIKNKDILESKPQGNIYVYGGIGLGKTMFLCEIIKRNLDMKPIYIYGSDISLIQKKDYAFKNIIYKYANYGLLVLDEVSFLMENQFALDLIIDLAYRDAIPLVICGNKPIKEFLADIGERAASRFAEDIQVAKFDGNDLRKKGVDS